MNIIGIIAIEAPDKSGEIFDVAGIDYSALEGRPLTNRFDDNSLENVLGRVLEVGTDADADAYADLKEKAAGKRFVWARCEVWDPGTMRALNGGLFIGFGVGGQLLERRMSQDGEVLAKTVLRELTLTTKPSHLAYQVKVV